MVKDGYKFLLAVLIATLAMLVVATALGVSYHVSRQTTVDPLPAAVYKSVSNLVGEDAEAKVPKMVSPITGRPVTDVDIAAAVPKPVKRIVNKDNTCAGVIREDGSPDGECPAEAANLPAVTLDEVLPFEGNPPD